MKHIAVSALAFIFLMVSSSSADDMIAEYEKAMKNTKPILFFVTLGKECPPCVRSKQALAEIDLTKAGFSLIIVDYYKYKNFAKKLGAQKYPYWVVYKKERDGWIRKSTYTGGMNVKQIFKFATET